MNKRRHAAVDGWMDRLAIILVVSLAILLCSGLARGQSGSFVSPAIRAGGGTDFAFWDLFVPPPGNAPNYNYNNAPALLDGLGLDDEGNPTTAFTARTNLRQIGASQCFVTSSGAIYSFAETTAFEVPYSPPTGSTAEVTNVVFQTQTGGTRMDVDEVRLVFTRSLPGGGTESVELPPVFRALDDPQTGAFSERLISAFQWDLTGQGARDFKITFAAPGVSMPIWQAQLDAVVGSPFVQQLGYLLFTETRPVTRYGRVGSVDKNLPIGVDGRFFLPGEQLNLLGLPEFDWEHVGFVYEGQVVEGYELPLTFPNGDATVTALFAPLTYAAWREAAFFHYNALTGTPADNTDAAVSGPAVDHDHDGLVNQAEYAFGCDPYAADSERAAPKPTVVTVAGQSYPAIQFRTNGAPDGYADVAVIVRESSDLTTWRDNTTETTPVTELVGRELQPDGTAMVTVRSSQPMAAGSRFFQVTVQ